MDREKALDMALGQIEKQFGKGSIMKLGERGHVGIEAIPTGALALDLALGIGGLPRGRIVEIFGPESSGKSTLATHVVAEAQRNGGVCAYIDAEHAMDPVYASAIGVNVDELLISQPDTGEQALEISDMLIRSGALDVLVIDSVAALVPRAEIEGEMGDSHMGLQARLMSQALRKLTGNLNRSRTIMIFINQLREKIGVMFGSPETTPGGRALKFYSSVRLDIRRIESIKDGPEVVGNRVRVKVVKNKTAPPFKQAEFDIMYGKGISREGSLLDVGVDLGIVKKAGAWFTYEGEQLGQGRENVKNFLAENVDLMVEISEKIKTEVGLNESEVEIDARRGSDRGRRRRTLRECTPTSDVTSRSSPTTAPSLSPRWRGRCAPVPVPSTGVRISAVRVHADAGRIARRRSGRPILLVPVWIVALGYLGLVVLRFVAFDGDRLAVLNAQTVWVFLPVYAVASAAWCFRRFALGDRHDLGGVPRRRRRASIGRAGGARGRARRPALAGADRQRAVHEPDARPARGAARGRCRRRAAPGGHAALDRGARRGRVRGRYPYPPAGSSSTPGEGGVLAPAARPAGHRAGVLGRPSRRASTSTAPASRSSTSTRRARRREWPPHRASTA